MGVDFTARIGFGLRLDREKVPVGSNLFATVEKAACDKLVLVQGGSAYSNDEDNFLIVRETYQKTVDLGGLPVGQLHHMKLDPKALRELWPFEEYSKEPLQWWLISHVW